MSGTDLIYLEAISVVTTLRKQQSGLLQIKPSQEGEGGPVQSGRSKKPEWIKKKKKTPSRNDRPENCDVTALVATNSSPL